MTSNSISWLRRGKTDERDGLLAPALYVSIFIAIFVVVTQCLRVVDAIWLSTAVQLTMWLVAAGLIVLLWIAYMACRAYLTGKRSEEAWAGLQARAGKAEAEVEQARAAALEANERRDEALAAKAVAEQEAKAAREQAAPARHGNRTDGSSQFASDPSEDGSAREDEDAWLPPDELKHLDGTERSVSTATVFPGGCYLEPDSIGPVVDKLTGRQAYQCRVVDLNPALKDRSHETVIDILASQEPSPPSMPRFGLVEFDELTITPYVTDRSPMRIRYSLRATGIHPAAPTAVERVRAMWTAPGSPEDVTSGKAGDGVMKDALVHILESWGVDVVEGLIQEFIS